MDNKECEDSSFELSCVKVEVEEIKTELQNQFEMNNIELAFSAATDALAHSIYLASLHFHQRGLPLRMKDLIFAPIGMYETWHETCTGAFQHFGLNRFNVNMVVETPTIVSEADMINGIKLALRLMDDVSKEIRRINALYANQIHHAFKATKITFEIFFGRVKSLGPLTNDSTRPQTGRMLSAQSPLERAIRHQMPGLEHLYE